MCHVNWSPDYAGTEADEQVIIERDREDRYHEIFNFLDQGGIVRGSWQTSSGRPVNINCLGATNQARWTDEDVRVIWTATRPGGGRFVIGWYENARVFRRRRRGTIIYPFRPRDSVKYRSECRASSAYLIPVADHGFQFPDFGVANP